MVRASKTCWLLIAFAALLSACSSEPTQIIVAVDSDLVIPTELDAIHFDVSGPDGMSQTSDAAFSGDGALPLPRTLALTRKDGAIGPYDVRVTGLLNGAEVIERHARVSFIEGRSVILVLRLLRSCQGQPCGSGMSCDVGGCRSVDIDPSELIDWTGRPDHLDGGLPPIDMFVPPADMGMDLAVDMTPPADMGADMDMFVPLDMCLAAELCNGHDDTCDGRSDEGFDLVSDLNNCGECGHVCTIPAGLGTPSCVNGQCRALCTGLEYADCNGAIGDGCEAPLDSPTSCGSCITMCTLQHATAGCDASMSPTTCSVLSCGAPYDDCDGIARNGCETNLNTNLNHCGSCTDPGSDCPDSPAHGTSRCSTGACVIDCDPGYADCDGEASTGCEANLNDPDTCGSCLTACSVSQPYCQGSVAEGFSCVLTCATGELCGSSCVDTTTSAQNCSACGTVCPSGANSQPRCSSSTCSITCAVGFDDCDGIPSTGCEQNVRLPDHCGSCTNVCNLPHVSEYSCETGSCAISQCAPGFADCDGRSDNGCEINILTNTSNCGGCGAAHACVTGQPHADTTCVMGMCQLACNPGYADCGPAPGCESALSAPTSCGGCGMGHVCTTDLVCQASMAGSYSCVAACSGGSTVHLCDASCVDTATDPANCNGCDMMCPARPHAVPTCSGSACSFSCAMNYGNCNSMVSDGCETDLRDSLAHCGDCSTPCPSYTNMASMCTGSACGQVCLSGWGNCNTMLSDGCEAMTNTVDNCGACGHACPATGANVGAATCDGTDCGIECVSDKYGDCDGVLDTGCEASFDSDPLHCGDCLTACSTGESCCSGACTPGACTT